AENSYIHFDPRTDAYLLFMRPSRRLGIWDPVHYRFSQTSDAECCPPGSGIASFVSPDGALITLISGNPLFADGSSIHLWNARDLKPITRPSSHSTPIRDMAFSPDSRTLASVANEKAVKLWDLATRRECLSIEHPNLVTQQGIGIGKTIGFSRDSRTLVIAV